MLRGKRSEMTAFRALLIVSTCASLILQRSFPLPLHFRSVLFCPSLPQVCVRMASCSDHLSVKVGPPSSIGFAHVSETESGSEVM